MIAIITYISKTLVIYFKLRMKKFINNSYSYNLTLKEVLRSRLNILYRCLNSPSPAKTMLHLHYLAMDKQLLPLIKMTKDLENMNAGYHVSTNYLINKTGVLIKRTNYDWHYKEL